MLDRWLRDAHDYGGYATRYLSRPLQGGIDAVRMAGSEPRTNAATEGHISHLKTPVRAPNGRAGCDLIRVCMLSLPPR